MKSSPAAPNAPINPACPHFLHGGDYNPDQWRATPEVWDEDMRLMKLAGCNAASIGIFSWSALEPEEGRFDFTWLDTVMDKMAGNGIYAVLATPSGARPAWMAAAYPEVLRVNADRRRILFGHRHNHCYTSPIYREKARTINARLAERYARHPALLVWHLSNEYGGDCHCPLCQKAFRAWLQVRYNHDLDRLNHAWWTGFWSHAYTNWAQIESPTVLGQSCTHGLNLDWKRFVTQQTIDFMKHEIEPLRQWTPSIPVTTNMMGTYTGLDYWRFAPELDVISWDSYPMWHGEARPDYELASDIAFVHDINRCLKGGRPFMLMESTPSTQNWAPVNKLKRPGMHILSSLQAVAHGADTVQYFQWRKGRGGCEKFHGAVVDHAGHEHTRVFREVAELGALLKQMDAVIGTTVPAEAAIVYDWENRWAIDDARGPRNQKKDYQETCQAHYRPFWKQGVPVDVIHMESDLNGYKLVMAPMLYMLRPGVADRLETFVRRGGMLVATYLTGIADENDLCFLGGFPGPLRQVLGIWAEEIDALYDSERVRVSMAPGNALGLQGDYAAGILCDLIHTETAQVFATYETEFFAGRPALTCNALGKGRAYYVASRNEPRFTDDFCGALIRSLGLKRALDADWPEGVTAQVRTDGTRRFVFLLNFCNEARTVALRDDSCADFFSGEPVRGNVDLPPFGARLLVTPSSHAATEPPDPKL